MSEPRAYFGRTLSILQAHIRDHLDKMNSTKVQNPRRNSVQARSAEVHSYTAHARMMPRSRCE